MQKHAGVFINTQGKKSSIVTVQGNVFFTKQPDKKSRSRANLVDHLYVPFHISKRIRVMIIEMHFYSRIFETFL